MVLRGNLLWWMNWRCVVSADRSAATTESRLDSALPQYRSEPAELIGREGMVTVWDDLGRYVGCMGVNLWRHLLIVGGGPIFIDEPPSQDPEGERSSEKVVATPPESLGESLRVTLAEAEKAIRAKATCTTNPAYQRHLSKFLRLLDWARS